MWDVHAELSSSFCMSYDFDDCADRSPPQTNVEPMDPHDLESVVILMELAAISLTQKPGDQFTREELLCEARRYSGDDINPSEEDMGIVLPFVRFLRKTPGKKYTLK